ncbi:MAG: AAA family ATPase [Syntrophobacterales bacterium]|nr:AAA family ATPase [Syntrophobacterales bacterium]
MNNELKYLDYFGLKYNPFPIVPDYEKFFLSEHIDVTITEIVHGILTRKGFMALTGDIGLGKTTISRKIISILEEKNVETSLVVNTMYQDAELLREINRDFGLDANVLNLSDQMNILNSFLINKNKTGKNCAIIIDDAQNLSLENLELIRMISNLETNREKLVQILLIGQPELMDKLDSPELSQLKSRIIIKEEARPLTKSELKNYILFKLNMAGNQGKTTVTNRAFRKIYGYSQGNFRRINILMDRCLYVAFLRNTTDIDQSVVNMAQRDLNPVERSRGKKNRYALSAVILIFFISGGVAFYMNMNLGIMGQGSGVRDQNIHKEKTPYQIGEKVYYPQKKTVLPEKTQIAEIPIPAALSDFLRYYKLSDYEIDFFKAMETGRFKDINDTIYEATGYQLVRFDNLPAEIQNNYALLDFISKKTGNKTYCLFWKPTIKVTRFYIGYEGDEIMKLEKLLAACRLYTFSIDGIVGPRLMRAVSRFQQKKGLPITGLPDEKTIFLLCHGGY